jgi:hypothetical protein
MDYELAKQLKDAGFPQTRNDASIISPTNDELVETLMYPTLEELIEACGEQFKRLEQQHTAKYDWWATAYSHGAIVCGGKTPEEAVGRLWLALHANGDASA